ncbi:sensor histidine kinase [Paenibacillus kobensis]|uniref:sensor histidine kinase n=1 Tax=Paenibacillus kobensis TaxID=59841 RepID=UPI000FDAAACF|nr:histidine kinase [Paenibacillus kobensis]
MKLGLDNIRLRNKMLIVYLLSVFTPIFLTNLIFYNVTSDNVKNQRMKDISRAVEQIRSEFRSEIEDAVGISSVFYTDHMLNETLEQSYDQPADYIEAYDSYLRRMLNSYGPVYHSVNTITVYADNPTVLPSGGIERITDGVRDQEWYRAIMSTRLSRPIIIRTGTGDSKDTFSIVRKLDYFVAQNQYQKLLKIDLKTDAIAQIFGNLNLQGSIYLIDDKGVVNYTTDPQINWRSESPVFDSIPQSARTIKVESTYDTYNYLSGWRVAATIAESEVIQAVKKSRTFVVVLAALNLLFATIIIVWITRSLVVRLGFILRYMKKVKNQQFDLIQHAAANDEIGQLTSEFNRMTTQIERLINDVYVADIQKKDLELQNRHVQLNALQSQINPHFLFNALETIRMRSLIKHEDETARIIHNMAKIFRNSLTWSKDMVNVQEELGFIHCFLEIQKYRFGDKLTYNIEIDEFSYECMVPKMTFLPFVENASIHGIEPLKNGGTIDLKLKVEGKELVCEIIDNGIGMSEEKVAKLYRYLESEEEMGDRIGIQNVIYRLKLYYGTGFRLQIDSGEGRGTAIRLVTPIDLHANREAG